MTYLFAHLNNITHSGTLSRYAFHECRIQSPEQPSIPSLKVFCVYPIQIKLILLILVTHSRRHFIILSKINLILPYLC